MLSFHLKHHVKTHLKSNVVAYLALVVALGGTSYAAAQLSNGHVKTRHIAKNAVTTKKVKNHTVKAKDLKVGVVKNGRVLAAETRYGVAQGALPPATPDSTLGTVQFTAPRKGVAYVRVSHGHLGVGCTDGGAYYGLYVDNEPVPGTLINVPNQNNERATELVASVTLTKGPHQASTGINCPDGDFQTLDSGQPTTWSVLLVG